MSALKNLWNALLRLPRLYAIGGGIAIVLVAVIGVHVLTRTSSATTSVSQTAHVTIASVASLSSQSGPLPVTGKVTSLSDATILAQSAGEITNLYRKIGDHVSAGDTIATLENSSQAAAVTQAQGSYAAAKVALAAASGNNAANSSLSSQQAAGAAQTAITSAQASLTSAYAALDDAVNTKGDTYFSNPHSTFPVFALTVPDSQLATNIVNERQTLDPIIAHARTLATSQISDIDAQTSQMISYAQTVESYMNDLVSAANKAQPNQSVSAASIAAAQASFSAARSEVVGAITSLTAAKNAYDAAQIGAQTASNSATAGTENNVAAAEANVQTALGALQAAQAALAKTIVRSPISGTIVSLPITQGDYIAAFSQVAEVSNPSALEIDAYVTAADAKTLDVEGKAMIDGSIPGVITSIAPALDPTTGKILVKIGISGNQSSLTDNDTVTVSLDRANVSSASQTAASSTSIVIPINAAKITPHGPVVFTVSSSTLVANPITLGTILGDRVTIVSGLSPEIDIVTDARGLSEGQRVIVDSQ